jgi:hypothetical protein
LHALTLTIVTSHLPLLRQQTFLSPTLPAFSHPPQESTPTVHPSRSAAVMAPPAVPPEASLDKMSAELTTEIMSHIRPHDHTTSRSWPGRRRGTAGLLSLRFGGTSSCIAKTLTTTVSLYRHKRNSHELTSTANFATHGRIVATMTQTWTSTVGTQSSVPLSVGCTRPQESLRLGEGWHHWFGTCVLP